MALVLHPIGEISFDHLFVDPTRMEAKGASFCLLSQKDGFIHRLFPYLPQKSAVRLLLCPKLQLAAYHKHHFIIHFVKFFHRCNIKFLFDIIQQPSVTINKVYSCRYHTGNKLSEGFSRKDMSAEQFSSGQGSHVRHDMIPWMGKLRVKKICKAVI
jgi:hypothetical protein